MSRGVVFYSGMLSMPRQILRASERIAQAPNQQWQQQGLILLWLLRANRDRFRSGRNQGRYGRAPSGIVAASSSSILLGLVKRPAKAAHGYLSWSCGQQNLLMFLISWVHNYFRCILHAFAMRKLRNPAASLKSLECSLLVVALRKGTSKVFLLKSAGRFFRSSLPFTGRV
jgi:hypothetical protein